jgi:hypothetical protein
MVSVVPWALWTCCFNDIQKWLKIPGDGPVNLIDFFIQICLATVWDLHWGVDDKIHRAGH